MWTNYLKIALRFLYNDRIYALINLVGLAIGVASCLVLGLFLQKETSYDRHFENHENIYRVTTERTVGDDTSVLALSSAFAGPWLARDFPEVEAFVRFTPMSRAAFSDQGNTAYWDRLYMVDSNVFEVFSHEVLAGDPATALTDPQSIAVSEKFARFHFGVESALGKTITMEGADYSIALVFRDLPGETHLKYDVLVARNELRDQLLGSERGLVEGVLGAVDYTYLLMADDFDVETFATISAALVENSINPVLENFNVGIALKFHAESVADVHLLSPAEQDLPKGNRFHVFTLAAVAVLVLLIACINYVNLATARYTRRVKEVGLRKLLGAEQTHLLIQFLLESILLTLLALLFGMELVRFILTSTSLNSLFANTLSYQDLLQPRVVVSLVASAASLGVLSGLYPALHLSRITPKASLSGIAEPGSRGDSARQKLVFCQFVISICVISSAVLMFRQMQYIQGMPLGFDPQNRLILSVRGADSIERLPAFVSELTREPGIRSASVSLRSPGDILPTATQPVETDEGAFEAQRFSRTSVDMEYLATLDIELVNGRNFTAEDLASEERRVLVNEAFVKQANWDEALGKYIGSASATGDRVIGVIRDYHYQDLHQPILPLELRLDIPYFEGMAQANRVLQTRILTLSLAPDSIATSLASIREKWQAFDPAHPFEYRFLDDSLNQLYATDLQRVTIVGIFSALSIFLSAMGLYGLSAFMTETRTQEIGIRKVMGASTLQIIVMLFKQKILKVILLASFLACGVSYWAVSRWLSSFYYQAEIDLFVYVLATLMVMVVSFITMATQAYKRAEASPVHALRHE
jgi:putative ABC transport system permease protein